MRKKGRERQKERERERDRDKEIYVKIERNREGHVERKRKIVGVRERKTGKEEYCAVKAEDEVRWPSMN